MMHPDFTFMMGVVFGALLFGFVQLLIRGRARKVSDVGRDAAAEADKAHREREVAELHERLAVLERIATDPATRTASEIEKLR